MSAVPFKVRALYEYASDYPDDLPFPAGQEIIVETIEDEEWYSGSYVDAGGSKKKGIFPRNFVETIKEEKPAVVVPRRPSHKECDIIEAQPMAAIAAKDEVGGNAPAQAEGTKDEQTESNPKKNAFLNRISTFNRESKPISPEEVTSEQSYHKKPPVKQFIAPNPPPVSSNVAESNDSVVSATSPISEEEEGPKLSLKERIALLQQRQAEEAAKAAEIERRKQEKREAKARKKEQEAQQQQQHQAKQANAGVASEAMISGEREDIAQVTDTSRISIESPEIGENGEFEGKNDLQEQQQEFEGEEDDEEEVKVKKEAGTKEEEEDEEDDDEEKNDDEEGEGDSSSEVDEEDEEEARKRALRERMAKLSGGMGMYGMMGMNSPFAVSSAKEEKAKKRHKKKVEETAQEEEDESNSNVPEAISIIPFANAAPILPKPTEPVEEGKVSVKEGDEEEEDTTAPVSHETIPAPPSRPLPVGSTVDGKPIVHDAEDTSEEEAFKIGNMKNIASSVNESVGDEEEEDDEEEEEEDEVALVQSTDQNFVNGLSEKEIGGTAAVPPVPPHAPATKRSNPSLQTAPLESTATGYEADDDETEDNTATLSPSVPHTSAPPIPPPSARSQHLPATPNISRTAASRPPPPIPPVTDVPPVPSTAPIGTLGRSGTTSDLPQSPHADYGHLGRASTTFDTSPPIPSAAVPPVPTDIRKTSVSHPHREKAPPPLPPSDAPPSPQVPQVPQVPAPSLAAPPAPQQLPLDHPPITASDRRQSHDATATATATARRSSEHHIGRSNTLTSESAAATDIDLNTTSDWWLKSELPPTLLSRYGKDMIFEVEDHELVKRGNKKVIYRDYYILYQDLSQLVIELHFNYNDPFNTLTTYQHVIAAPSIRKELLDYYSQEYGLQIVKIAESLGNSNIGYNKLVPYVFEKMMKRYPVLQPIGTRAYGQLVYRNSSNQTINKYDDIKAGDILSLKAKFQGHNKLHQKFQYEVGTNDSNPFSCIVYDFDSTKNKFKVFETDTSGKISKVSYKIGDLKSGQLRVYRCVGRDYINW
ncbi:hypothetical protein PACTADRAFT_49885 [Pachysolen tannophilus NRRL Y-2460]|uniref:SH3 domain-containing protein n=1 Tax=Pachysolen tannophilus NRRL Y-2460 TaxID=669874 RepID=A0A1E4TTS1_PACTA|nr:hypothetical protein PACTADRAFT_49885 [Pachysolen tannophilus NRRL Y-2460]